MIESKRCSRCELVQPVENFNRRGQRAWQNLCRPCQAQATAERLAAEPARKAAYYQANKQRWKSHAELTERQREIKRERSRRWRAENPERFKQQLDDWRARNPERFNALSRQRTARKRGNGVYKILKRDLRRLYLKPCIYCGKRENITLDHVVPIARGGVHGIGNLAPACKPCNSSKRDKTVMEWRMGKAPTA